MIVLENLRKIFPNGRGVRGVDLEFGPGIHGLLGPNGAGKTTILRLVMGLLVPGEGRVLVDGRDIWEHGGDFSYRRGIGYFPAEGYFFNYLSGRQNLEYLGLLRCGDRDAHRAVLDVLGEFAIEGYWDGAVSTYSSGMRKKIELAGSLLGSPSTLIWDEPNDGVDIMGNLFLRDYLVRCRDEGKTVILSSHVLEFMDGLLDSLTVLDEGRVCLHAEPAPADLRGAFLGALGRTGRDASGPSAAAPRR